MNILFSLIKTLILTKNLYYIKSIRVWRGHFDKNTGKGFPMWKKKC
jgi:hypothetical protein